MTAAAPGPLAEEAVRLVEAITDWARSSVSGGGDPASSQGGGGPSSESDPSAATAAECQVCPVCSLLGVLRRAQPETFAHLAAASASMAAALRTLVEHHDHEPGSGGAPSTPGVERIDLDASSGSVEDDEPVPSTGGSR